MSDTFISVEQACEELRKGKMIIMVDDEDRENEGDLVVSTEHITPEHVNFMTKHARGLICASLTQQQVDKLQIPMMAPHNDSKYHTPFTVAIEAATGVSTGISVQDRCRTIQVASDPASTPSDVVMPGHIFPLAAKDGGVLVRSGHTEGSVDLMKIAGLRPAAAICEILKDDGSVGRLDYLKKFAKQHDLSIVAIKDIIAYRMQQECLVSEVSSCRLPMEPYGEFTMKVLDNKLDDMQHIALIKGEINPDDPVLVRVHSECITGDTFGSTRCDCGWQLRSALTKIGKEGGVLLYMHQEGRGIGLGNKIKAYALQDQGLDTVEANHKLGFKADHRDYGIGSQILRFLGIKKMRLLTNNPRKIHGIDGYNLEIVGREPIEAVPNKENRRYLETKKHKLGHLLDLEQEA